MITYHVPQRVVSETDDHVLGRLRFEFEAGEHVPSSVQEEYALKRLVFRGLADIVPDEDDEDDPVDDAPEPTDEEGDDE